MANLKKEQEEAIASINTAKALVDKVVTIMELMLVDPSASMSIAASPMAFLLMLLKEAGITREKLEFFLTHFLVLTLPSLEISVKTILLTNLKNMISCSVDPRIPEKYRKQHKTPTNYNTSQEYGIDINIESIDFMDKLSINPLGEFGKDWYFGLEGVDDSYKFARADDMDAFLWFVIHKGKFPNSSKISNIGNLVGGIHQESGQVTPSSGSLLNTLEVSYSNSNSSSILVGNTFTYTGSSEVISMCIDRKYDDNDNIVHNTLVPISDDWSSVNWYARRADQLGKNLGFGWGVNRKNGNTKYKGKSRNFSKERAICNIQYIDQASSDAPLTGLVNNKFRFTVLPKPLVHIPNLAQGEPPWRFKKLLFDSNGNYDPNGKYTIYGQADNDNLSYTAGGTNITIDPKSGNVTVDSKTELVKHLVECYPGLTVFEFNYDYIMSIKLFDAKVLAHSLMESVLNVRMGLVASIRHEDGTEAIKQIIKNILETDESDVSDCYYTFDNSKYDSLLRKAEEKRARQERFGDVTHESGIFDSVSEILSEYDANAELHEQIDVIHKAITQASVIVSEGVEEENKADVEFGFVLDLVEALTTAIVNGILSPKVLMLLEVNQKMMGGTWEKFTLEDLLRALESTIIAIVKEVRDLILQELLKLLEETLAPLKETVLHLLVREQLEYYSDAIMDIIRNCPSIWFRFGNTYEDTKLDTVDYADIDVSHTKEGEQPSTNKC